MVKRKRLLNEKAVFMIPKYDYEEGTFRSKKPDAPEICSDKLRAALTRKRIKYATGYNACSSCGITEDFYVTAVDMDTKWESALRSARVKADFASIEDDDTIYDIRDKKYVIHCSICKKAGHTKTTCKLNTKKYKCVGIQCSLN
tara:strand:- start:13439 stop:13870 length:432 start_codon:yes stop_codon:yes gene_type:complete